MPQLSIHVPPAYITAALDMPPERREFIEDEKAKQAIDEHLKEAAIRHKEYNAGLEDDLTEEEEAQFLANIRDTLDIAIALVALCDTVDQVAALHQVGQSIGRRHKRPVSLPTNDLFPRLRKVFDAIQSEYGLGADRTLAKKLSSRKVVAAIAIINHALANSKTQ